MAKERTCYLMVKDVPGGLEYGVEYDLDEGEELPEDVEDLTEAQYTMYMFIKTLEGTFDKEAKERIEKQAQDKPSGIVVPH